MGNQKHFLFAPKSWVGEPNFHLQTWACGDFNAELDTWPPVIEITGQFQNSPRGFNPMKFIALRVTECALPESRLSCRELK